MMVIVSDRGFQMIVHPRYVPPHDEIRVVGISSAIGDYDHSFDRPGSSALWIGDHIHLNRDEVLELICRLQLWLATGKLDQ